MSAVPAPEPRSRPAAASTREQLDELDALLQRMLDLPVDPAADGRPGFAVAESPAPAAAPEKAAPAPPVSPPPAAAVPPPPRPAPAATPPRPESPAPEEAPLPPAAETPLVTGPGRASGDRAPLWLRLLVWGNHLFDRGAGRLGAPGHWLRRPLGRAVLGWTGLALLAAAIGLVLLDWIGWPW
jgi:hypothetical protein